MEGFLYLRCWMCCSIMLATPPLAFSYHYLVLRVLREGTDSPDVTLADEDGQCWEALRIILATSRTVSRSTPTLSSARKEKVKMEARSKPACKFHQYGHCKFSSSCRNFHTWDTCLNPQCSQNTCSARHPKPCRFFLPLRECQGDSPTACWPGPTPIYSRPWVS